MAMRYKTAGVTCQPVTGHGSRKGSEGRGLLEKGAPESWKNQLFY